MTDDNGSMYKPGDLVVSSYKGNGMGTVDDNVVTDDSIVPGTVGMVIEKLTRHQDDTGYKILWPNSKVYVFAEKYLMPLDNLEPSDYK